MTAFTLGQRSHKASGFPTNPGCFCIGSSFTVYSNEHGSDTKLSQSMNPMNPEYELSNFVSEKN